MSFFFLFLLKGLTKSLKQKAIVYLVLDGGPIPIGYIGFLLHVILPLHPTIRIKLVTQVNITASLSMTQVVT